ncbi:bidirectional sugar transporter SWEET9 [Capsicum chacoense]|uniref:Bidirectional sugar transporter SWEET n=1 Tax=Capsicum annuum TaxID=4072 RepID=A0A1U8H0M7_CAPAN|nr:bidirectional sugar transporter SWEET9 [Capsicum annuum]KAF3644093.1 Bidirectional sugar transporter SWEET14 [Capsicum annuum]KAF3655595.1 Bidirectional sugar transporter SWEET14 [Capsicum annuum]PHT79867.1 Bidirectional sugar transporter SWEET14 [Capsicum annuum]
MVNLSHLAPIFGTLGSIVSFIVFLSPLPTFYNIYKKKSSEGYQSIPYVVALFSALLTLYYALLKGNMIPVIIINAFGIFIETIYVGFYFFYASKKAKIQTMKFVLLFVGGGFGAIVLVVQFLFHGAIRAQIVGWICIVFSVGTFAAPLCILRKVIKTKSVEYMPFLLSAFLTLSAVMWFIYGLLLKDIVIYSPNILGFAFGVVQMVLYMMYKNHKDNMNVTKEQKLPELLQNHVIILDDEKKLPHLTEEQIIDIWKLGTLVYSEKLAAEVEKNKPKLQTVET